MDDRLRCKVEGCEGKVESNPTLYLSAWADGTWTIQGVADEAAEILCDEFSHENGTDALQEALSAMLEREMPGTTWAAT